MNDEDRAQFENILSDIMKNDFKVKFSDVVVNQPIVYGDFMNLDMDPRPYLLVEDHVAVSSGTKILNCNKGLNLLCPVVFSV